jgi:plasmid maintenance system antidote protein VapI
MAYDNLRGEMTKRHKTQDDMAELLKISRTAVNYKLNHRIKFTLREAFTIQREWFPDRTIEYLFGDDIEKAS